MIRTLATGIAVAAMLAGGAQAENFEVKMLNKGVNGDRMVFEPAFIRVAVGDTVTFRATDKGHNAETIDGLIAEGAGGFAGKINQELEVTLTEEGFYAIKCKPHFAMGMVMTIAVGDGEAPDGFLTGRIPPKAKERLETQLSNL